VYGCSLFGGGSVHCIARTVENIEAFDARSQAGMARGPLPSIYIISFRGGFYPIFECGCSLGTDYICIQPVVEVGKMAERAGEGSWGGSI
jgi:hypothetical protein